MIRLAATLVLAIGAVLSAPAPPAQGKPPQGKQNEPLEFVDAASGSYGAYLDKVVPVGGGSAWSIATVRVENFGKSWFEPLTLAVAQSPKNKGRMVEAARVPDPHKYRLGRPVPPGGKVLYEILLQAPADTFEPLKAACDITDKLYFRGDFRSAATIKVLSKTTTHPANPKNGALRTATQLEVQNTGERAVDAVFHATFRAPKGVETLLTIRLNPQEKKLWLVSEVPGGPKGSWPDADIAKLELVDWCEIFEKPGGAAASRPETSPSSRPASRPTSRPERHTPTAPPTGPAADALRAAWNASYRFPDGPVRIVGDYTVETPATDASWQGQRKLAGTFTLEGFSRGEWSRGTATIREPDLDPVKSRALGDVVIDRFRLWFFRDATGRPPFDEAFDGAVITKDRDAYLASAGRIARAELADGRIGKLVFRANGLERAIEYARVGPHWAAIAYRTGEETLRATWADAGGGWLFPSSFEFRSVFGKSWGPEKMTITNVVVTP